jgi:hypothetical protein
MRRFAVISVLVSAMSIAGPALATKVSGKIVVTKEFREALSDASKSEESSRLEGYWNEPNGIIPVLPPRVDPSRDLGVVIFKEGAKPPGPNQLSTVKVRAGGMERSVIVTRPKSTIRLRSVDPFDHELYSPEIDSFRPERQAKNAFRPIEFPKEGIYHLRCKLMPHFNAYVVVTNATLVVEVDRKGDFTLEDVEPGKYTIKVFHGGKWVHEQKFEVEEDKKKKEVRVEVKLVPKKKPAKADKKKKDAEGKQDGKGGEKQDKKK